MKNWMDDANCRGMDTSLFFPENGMQYDPFVREVCFSCDVQERCLEFAIDNFIDFGMYGGMSPRERDAWRTKYRSTMSSLSNETAANLS